MSFFTRRTQSTTKVSQAFSEGETLTTHKRTRRRASTCGRRRRKGGDAPWCLRSCQGSRNCLRLNLCRCSG